MMTIAPHLPTNAVPSKVGVAILSSTYPRRRMLLAHTRTTIHPPYLLRATGSEGSYANAGCGGCLLPQDGMSDIAEEGEAESMRGGRQASGWRRRRSKRWPLLDNLEEWSREEEAVRSEGTRSKKVSEPTYINGRLRPSARNNGWHREAADAPYRFTYLMKSSKTPFIAKRSQSLPRRVPLSGIYSSLTRLSLARVNPNQTQRT